MTSASQRPFFAPECLQISSMDCGVAATFTLLAGYGVSVSYERLRELCQTGVDGTSIDSLEDLCNGLGVEVVQHVVPPDLAVSAMEGRYPLIATIAHSAGVPHYVTVWRRVGSYLQVMDPAGGRKWMHQDEFRRGLYVHPLRLPTEDWSVWMQTNSFREALAARLRGLLTKATAEQVTAGAFSQLDPEQVRAVDASIRLVERTSQASGAKGRRWNDQLFRRAQDAALHGDPLTEELWAITVRGGAVVTRGAVFLARESATPGGSSRSFTASSGAAPPPGSPPPGGEAADVDARIPAVALRAVAESSSTPSLLRELRALLGPEARSMAYALVGGVLTLTFASTLELVVYRAAVDGPRLLTTWGTRMGGAVGLGTLVFLILALEAAAAFGGGRLGRHLELKVRMATLHSLPRVDDHFIRSRPTSDLAYRAHNLVTGGHLPASMLSAVRAAGDLAVTLAAIAWLDVRFLPPAVVGGALIALTFVFTRSRVRELDSRNQVHASRLLTLFLDALRGVRPVRLHGYQEAFRTEQAEELSRWRRTGDALVRTNAALDSVNGAVGTALLVSVFCFFCLQAGDPRVFVLLAFWAFRVPPLITALVMFAQTYPLQRLAFSRLLEVTRYASLADQIGPPKAERGEPAEQARGGVSVAFRDLTVVASGATVLNEIDLDIPAGQHVAIVGPSGAGKSSLVSVLLGFHKLAAGEVTVDGLPLDERSRRQLLAVTSWVDPAVHLWNETVRANVDYASEGLARRPFLETAELSELLGVLDQMDRGLETPVGPEGALVSGGEGQRIRAARAFLRADTRLVVLDEAFRGLDRDTRARLAANARRAWRDATMFFVSHDIRQALQFDRVLVVDGGRVIEDGPPGELASRDSRFRRLLDAEHHALETLWSGTEWRRIRVAEGGIADDSVRR